MDDLISNLIDSYFTEESKEDIVRSFDLFDFYEYQQAYSSFIDLANEHSTISSDTLKDRFTLDLHTKLDYILNEHGVKLTNDTSIYIKNEVLTSLAHLQKLEDYTTVIRTLESTQSDEIQLALIISDTSMLEMEDVMVALESVNPNTLLTLKEYIYTQEDEAADNGQVSLKVLDNYKLFNSFINKPSLGSNLIENGILIGSNFSTYLDYIESDVVSKDNEQTALNFLSVILLSIDGYNSPLLMYRKYSFRLLQDLNKVSAVEVLVLNLISNFTEYKKAEIEKNRLSQASSQA